ncbi:aldehyde dehydrogenase family protein [Roseibacillus persicicus]|uniref:aldehyde dehydrogenase family protein n=1 Tax=Roseibacillus persicicus TaxID=454148 RepID=UPI00398ABC7A
MNETPTARLEQLLESQKTFFDSGKTRDLDARLEALERFEKALEARQEEILEALAKDLGKPTLEAFLSEYYFLLQEVRLVRKSLKRWLRPRRVSSPFYFWPCRNEVCLEPHGRVLIISPWNYPVQLALAPLLGAVAAGNTVILKPSEETPASAALLEKLLGDCFPPEWVAVVQGGAEFTSSLLEHRFDFLFFTGSTRVGKIVAEKAASQLIPHVLELGGKCPCVVDATADLEVAAKRILIGKLFNAGQTCFAPDFVAVEAGVKDELVKALQTVLQEHPWEQEMGTIVNSKHYQRLKNLCRESDLRKGEDDEDALHLAPRIAASATWEDEVMEEEIFGPILPVVAYETKDELFAQLSKRPEPLALYCFSREEEFVELLTTRVSSGGVCINDVGKHAMNLKSPFGGKGESGYGRYRGKDSVRAFSYERTYTKRYFINDPFESLPPRAKQTELLRKWMK